MKLGAVLKFNKITYKTKRNNLPFTITGTARARNDTLKFKNLVLETAGGNVKLKGKAVGFTSYVCNFTEGFKSELEASADQFDLTPLLQNTRQKKVVNESKKIAFVSGLQKSGFEFKIALKLNKLTIRRLHASHARAIIQYADSLIALKKLDFEACEGKLSATGTLYNFERASADITVKHMDIEELFDQCENFGQKAILKENVLGVLSATAGIDLRFTEQFKIDPGSMSANVKAVIKEGHLINYAPLQKVGNYIFRRRNFNDVNFTEMDPEFEIRGSKMKFTEMEVATNVLNFFVSGTYDFKGESSLNVIVPWNNLKHRSKDYVPEKSLKEGATARGIKLNLYGQPNKIRIRLGNH